ncbi:hypothetical protein FHS09_002234 [Microbulbifer rhizosphaerae]|uniref:Uncharacterized protein n=1 Tax=Microbulbifer rhizosphaerae TaxID=1562603 RepID=A0A7W4WD53_9GAMM|nr:hypothetical protein [Microbulbifer rhizosphaerae]
MMSSETNDTQAIRSAKQALILNKVKPQATAQRTKSDNNKARSEVKKP